MPARTGWTEPAATRSRRSPTECVDSTGAGDAFDAALLRGVADRRGSALDALRAGYGGGRRVVGRLGAHPAPGQPSITG